MAYDYNIERMEAVAAGNRARRSLEMALSALNSARGWGIFDILGGGFLSSIIKHSQMEKAAGYIEEAKRDLAAFSRELGDIEQYANVDLNTGDFWGFADWFFDGFLSDVVIQSRISDARDQVLFAISKVDSILEQIS